MASTHEQRTGALRQLREAVAMNQPDFAAQLGVSAKTVSRWETGERLPPREKVLDMVHQLRDRGPSARAALGELIAAWEIDPAACGLSAAPASAPRPPPAEVRTRVDLALLKTAESLDLSPRGLRAGLRAVLEAVESSGYTMAEIRALM